MSNYISIDFGTKKSGFAYSVENFCFAWKTVPTKEIFNFLEKAIREKNPKKIIVWMPYNIDGSLSEHAKRVQKFAKKIENFGIPIILHDERLTSSEAKIAFEEFDFAGDVDSEAARLILENYLEYEKREAQ